jgi:hypothetical protein
MNRIIGALLVGLAIGILFGFVIGHLEHPRVNERPSPASQRAHISPEKESPYADWSLPEELSRNSVDAGVECFLRTFVATGEKKDAVLEVAFVNTSDSLANVTVETPSVAVKEPVEEYIADKTWRTGWNFFPVNPMILIYGKNKLSPGSVCIYRCRAAFFGLKTTNDIGIYLEYKWKTINNVIYVRRVFFSVHPPGYIRQPDVFP